MATYNVLVFGGGTERSASKSSGHSSGIGLTKAFQEVLS